MKNDFQYRIYLLEEVSCELFLQHTLLGDEIEEILAGLGSLHHNDVGI